MRELKIGDTTITSIIERDGPWREPQGLFPTCDIPRARKHLEAMGAPFYDAASGKMVITYQTYVVRTPRHLILIDTCLGDNKGFAAPMNFDTTPWLANFAKAGLRVEDIDYVFCTHLDIDHTGWNTQLIDSRWTPTFPNARYVFHRREYEYREMAQKRGEDPSGEITKVWQMNCLPIFESGQALMVDESYSLDDTIFFSLTPGHSPFHCNIHVRSKGDEAIVTGDLMHHALQCPEPDWSTRFCYNPAMAAETRWKFFGEMAGTSKVILPIHFVGEQGGLIEADGKTFRYKRI